MATQFNPKFAPGDIVRLNSGSPDLTVMSTYPWAEYIGGEYKNYVCVSWIDETGESQSIDANEDCFTKVVSEELTAIFAAIFTDPTSDGFPGLNPPDDFEDDGQGGIEIGGGR